MKTNAVVEENKNVGNFLPKKAEKVIHILFKI